MHRALGRLRCSSCTINATRQQYSTASLGEAPRLSYAPIRAPLQRYNALISRLADKGDLVRALQLAQELKRNLIETGQKPDLTTYEVLAKAFALHGLSREALQIVDDAKAEGINPDIGVWNQVLRVRRAPTVLITL
jgi:pentatricopeptide repeat protein